MILISDPIFERHQTGRHPECAARLAVTRKHLHWRGLDDRCRLHPVRPASAAELARVHLDTYVESVDRLARSGGGRLDPDTVVSPDSFDVARHAAGSAIAAVDRVLEGPEKHALCLVRPPGHHALADRAMGFCLFNNISAAAAHARTAGELNRVLIVDWDVHHGNGAQDIFYDDGNVYFFSAHRAPFYPGTGDAEETGVGEGLGATLNLPLRFGLSRREYRQAFAQALEAAATRCRPELILLSAGFDAHARDPIGSLGLETEDFADLTQMVLQVADQHCGGKLVSLLEGGYDLESLAESVACHVETILTHESQP